MDVVFKSYKHHYTVYAEMSEKEKQRDSQAKVDESVSILGFHSLNRNVGELSPLISTKANKLRMVQRAFFYIHG